MHRRHLLTLLALTAALAGALGVLSSPTVAQTDTGSWASLSGTLAHPRHEAGFVEVNGRLYLVGGRNSPPVEIYDPATDTWTTGATAPLELHHFQAVAVGSKIYVVGAFTGFFPNETPVPNVYVYDTVANSWSQGPSIPAGRRRGSAAAVVQGGLIYVVGGVTNGHVDGTVGWVDTFNPATGVWTALPNDLPNPRDHAAAAIVGNTLYVASGRFTGPGSGVFGGTVGPTDAMNLTTNTWTTIASIPTRRAGTAIGVLGDEVIVIGGESDTQSQAHSEVEALDTSTGTWRSLAPLPAGEDRHGAGAALHDCALYVASGAGAQGAEPELNTVVRFAFASCDPGGPTPTPTSTPTPTPTATRTPTPTPTPPPAAETSRLVMVTPTRIFDSRTASPPSAPIPAGGWVDVQVAGVGAVPPNATAVVMNLTATGATAPGFVTAYPAGMQPPATASVNVSAGDVAANLLTVPVGANGSVSVFANMQVDVVGDLLGYYVPATSAAAGRYVPLSPARLLDTRSSTPIGAGSTRHVAVTASSAVPDAGVGAVVVTITSVDAAAPGYLTAYPSGQDRPFTANLNARPGGSRSNSAIVSLGPDGGIDLFSLGATDVVVDITGYFTDAASAPGTSGLFVPTEPSRRFDTRVAPAPQGVVGPNGSTDVVIAGTGSVPPGALASLQNVTSTGALAAGFVTVHPTGTARPLVASTTVPQPSVARGGSVIAPTGVGGAVTYYSNAGTHLVVDVVGYYAG